MRVVVSKGRDGKGANGSKNRPHDAYPVRCRVSVFYEPCSERVRVFRIEKYRQIEDWPNGGHWEKTGAARGGKSARRCVLLSSDDVFQKTSARCRAVEARPGLAGLKSQSFRSCLHLTWEFQNACFALACTSFRVSGLGLKPRYPERGTARVGVGFICTPRACSPADRWFSFVLRASLMC